MEAPAVLIAGRYRLVRRVGSGGMGVVWEAWDERLHRPVAVKQLHAQLGLSESETHLAHERAMREARITARLDHPNAVPVFDVVEHDGQPCLIMQFLPSQPLSLVLRERNRLPADEVARIGAQVASALAAAHRLGIVHRDVKPGNVLIADNGTARISDFGISHALGDVTLTSTGMVHGTPAYLAPEVARGAESSFSSDVFGLGATLYAAVEGAPPFGVNPNPIALLYKVASGEFNPPSPDGPLTPLLTRMLSATPAERPGMGEVAGALGDLRSSAAAEPSAGAVGAAEPTRVEHRGNRATPWTVVGPGPRSSDSERAEPKRAESERAESERAESEPAESELAESGPGGPETPAATRPLPRAEGAAALDAAALGAGAVGAMAASDQTQRSAPGRAAAGEDASPVVSAAQAPGSSPRRAAPRGDNPYPAAPAGRRRRRLLVGVLALVAVVALAVGLLPVLQRATTATSDASREASADPTVSESSTTSRVPSASASSARASTAPPTSVRPSNPASASSRPSPTPSPTTSPSRLESSSPPAASDEPSAAQLERAVASYYDQLPADTDAGWSRLSESYQENRAGSQSRYERFWGGIERVSVSRLEGEAPDRAEATVTYYLESGLISEERTAFRLVEEDGELRISNTRVLSSARRI